MKNFTFYIVGNLLLLSLLCGCNNGQYRLHGTVDNEFNGQMAQLRSYNDMDSVIYSDSVMIKDGKFDFKGKELLKGFTFISIETEEEYLYSELFLEQGDIFLNLGKDEYKSRLQGTPFNELYQSYKDSSLYFITEVNKHDPYIGNAFVIRSGTEAGNIWLAYGAYIREFERNNINNIVGKSEFLSSIARGAEGYYKSVNKLSFSEMYDFLDSAMLNHPKVLKYLEDERNRAIKAKEQKLIGSQYTDFELLTPDGKKKRLSDYVGHEYVYLDFWASWCGPCIADMPHLKEVYEKYHDKGLEIVGITLDEKKSDWTAALERLELPWPQLWSPENISDIQKTYGAPGVPYGVLIDKTGKIISAEIGSSFLEIRLESLLK